MATTTLTKQAIPGPDKNTPRETGRLILAGTFALTALGVSAFWASWFASGDYASAGDACYRAFENAFPIPDGVMSMLLVAAALGLVRRSAIGAALGLSACGMLLYLASLDTLYNLQHGAFMDWSDPGETISKIYISLHCYALGIWGIAAFRSARRKETVAAFRPASRLLVGTFCAVVPLGLGISSLHWFVSGQQAAPECVCVFRNAFPLADGLVVAMALLAVADVARRRQGAVVWGLAVCGGLGFRVLIGLAFRIGNAGLFPGDAAGPVALEAGILAATLFAARALWLLEPNPR